MRLQRLLLLALALTACAGQQPQASTQSQSKPTVLGMAELAMGAPPLGAQGGLRAMSASLEPIDGITFTWKSTYNVKDAAGNRYLNTTYAVHNGRTADPRNDLRNFTVVALARAGGIAGTAITRVTNFAGNDASQRAREVMPAAAITNSSPGTGVVDSLNTGMQVLLPEESAALQTAALNAQPKPAIGANDVVLDYGFVVKNAAGQHVVAPGQDGSLTFSFRVPATDAGGDPYSFNMSFLLTTTSTTRVTETLEEQGNPSLVTARSSAASAVETIAVAGTRLSDASVKTACNPRVAAGIIPAYLADGRGSPAFDGIGITNSIGVPVPDLTSVPPDSRVAAFFKGVLFSQAPAQEGSLVLHGSLTGIRKGSKVAPSSMYAVPNGFLPGEIVQVSVQPKDYTSCEPGTVIRTPPTGTRRYRVGVERLSEGTAAFVPFGSLTSIGVTAQAISVGDINRDGVPDIIYLKAGAASSHVQVLRYSVALGAYESAKPLGIGGTVTPTGLSLADLDSDGRLDLLVADKASSTSASGVVRIYANRQPGDFQTPVVASLAFGPGPIVAADLSGDGYQDAVVLHPATRSLSVLTNDGSGKLSSRVIDTGVTTLAKAITIAEVDGKNGLDIVVTDSTAGSTPTVLFNNGSGSAFEPRTLASVDSADTIIALSSGDLDEDGLDDVVAGLSTGVVAVWPSSDRGGSGAVTKRVLESPRLWDIATGDWDSDGDIDVAVSVGYTDETALLVRGVAALVNNGDGSLTYNLPAYTVKGHVDNFAMAPADVNGDKDLDIVTSFSAVGYLSGVK